MDRMGSWSAPLLELFGSFVLLMLVIAAFGLLNVGRIRLEQRLVRSRTLDSRQILGWIVLVTLSHGIGLVFWGENTSPGYNGAVLVVTSLIYSVLFLFSKDN